VADELCLSLVGIPTTQHTVLTYIDREEALNKAQLGEPLRRVIREEFQRIG
jgi:hypothetical protein